jgi:NAD(P)-dependent dehydrogenase (short-subunit alcohol dehydrogenase family)
MSAGDPDMARRLAGASALVTGGARGIGYEIALELAREGADVAVADLVSEEEGHEVVGAVCGLGRRSTYIRRDLSGAAQARCAVEDAISALGHVDLLVNNAGGARVNKTGSSEMGYRDFLDITEAEFDEILGANLKSAFFCSQAAARHMRAAGGGSIVNIGSEQAYIGFALLTHYTAAKGGIIALTRSLARALAPAIRVNAVCPGPIATPAMASGIEMTEEARQEIPLERWGTPLDVARSVTFLASADGAFYTGQTLDPNGGTVMP